MRAKNIELIQEHFTRIDSALNEMNNKRNEFSIEYPEKICTCDNCTLVCSCEFAFDFYNTDGDCLASK